jgi:tetratricopeptide (TPR) repeat protein
VDATLRKETDSEIAVELAIADARQALAAPDPAALNAAAEKVPVSTDARLRYAKAALAVTAAARAKEKGPLADSDAAALKQLPLDVGGERANLLKQIVALTTAPPPVVDAGVAVVPAATDAGTVTAADAGAAGTAVAEPETYETLMAKAERARITDRPGAARDAFNKALKLRPSSARAWMGLGWASLDLDRKGDAVKAFRKALAIDDGLADAHFGLAEALRFSGQKDQALDEYRTYLKMDPTGKDASIAKNAIESLQ